MHLSFTRGFPPSMSPFGLVCLALAAVKCRLQARRFSQSVGSELASFMQN